MARKNLHQESGDLLEQQESGGGRGVAMGKPQDLDSQKGPLEHGVRNQCVSYWAAGSGQLLSWDI